MHVPRNLTCIGGGCTISALGQQQSNVVMTRIKASPVLQASLHPVHTSDWVLLKQFFLTHPPLLRRKIERVGACVYKGKKIARWWMRRRCPIQNDDDWAFAYSSALIAVEYASVPLESLLRPFCKRYEHSCLCVTWLGSKKRVGLRDHVPCKTQDLRWLLRDVLMYQAPFADSHEGFLPTFFLLLKWTN